MLKVLTHVTLATSLVTCLYAQTAPERIRVSLDATVQLDRGTVRAQLQKLLPARIDKPGAWTQVGGGADDIKGPGFAYKLFLRRDAVRVEQVETGFDVEIDITFDVDVRKRFRFVFAKPLFTGSTDDNRRATIKARIRPCLTPKYDVASGLHITDVVLHNDVVVKHKVIKLIKKNLSDTVRSRLKSYLNDRVKTVDSKLNAHIQLKTRLQREMARLGKKLGRTIVVQEATSTSPRAQAKNAIAADVRIVAALKPREMPPAPLPSLQIREALGNPMKVAVTCIVSVADILKKSLPQTISIDGTDRVLAVQRATLSNKCLRVSARVGDANVELKAKVALNRARQRLVLSARSVSAEDVAIQEALHIAMPDVLILDMTRFRARGLQRIRQSLGVGVDKLGLELVGVAIETIKENKRASEKIEVTVGVMFRGELVLK